MHGGRRATPVPTPACGRLAAVVDRARRGGGSRNVRKWLEMDRHGADRLRLRRASSSGWYGAAHSAYQYQEIPYLISGGLLGVALVIGGGVLVRSAWSMRQIEEERRNALAIVRSVDRLERILRSLDEDARRADHEKSTSCEPGIRETRQRHRRAARRPPWPSSPSPPRPAGPA